MASNARRSWPTASSPISCTAFWIATRASAAGAEDFRAEQQLLRTLQRPEFNIHGLRRADVRALLPHISAAALSRQLKRLLCMGVIKRVSGTYRYYLTRLDRAAIAAACSLTQFNIVLALAIAK